MKLKRKGVDWGAVKKELEKVKEDRESRQDFRQLKKTGGDYILKGITTYRTPQRCVFFDCETTQHRLNDDEIEQRFWFCCASYVKKKNLGYGVIHTKKPRDERTFKNSDEFCEWLVSKAVVSEPLYVFAHNMEFDIRVARVLEWLTDNGWRASGIGLHSNGKTFLLDAVKKKSAKRQYEIKFISTTNYFPFSLAKIGESFGLEKIKESITDENGNLDYSKPFELWEQYCRRDVEIMEKAVHDLQNMVLMNSLGSFASTASSLAFNALRVQTAEMKQTPDGRLQPFTPFVVHKYPTALELEYDSYFGGRSEAFRVGKFKAPKGEQFYKLDVNSMYPAIMRDKPLPCRLSGYETTTIKITEKDRAHFLAVIEQGYGIIARCKLNVPVGQERYVKKLSTGQSVYPVGEFETVLAPESVRVALEKGHLVEIGERCLYLMTKESEKFVNFFWEMRLKAKKKEDRVQELFAKLVLNSCYGKTGQQNDVIEMVDVSELPDEIKTAIESTALDAGVLQTDLDTGERNQLYTVLGTLFCRKGGEKEPGANSFPFYASAVTDYARNLLFDYFEVAGLENLYYSDTDSLIVNEQGYLRLQSAGLVCVPRPVVGITIEEMNDCYPLGGLTLEATSEEMQIFNSKDYIFDGKQTLKGIRSNDEYNQELDAYKTEQWTSIKSSAKEKSSRVVVKTVLKRMHRVYYKRQLHEDGSTTPWNWNYEEWMILKKLSEMKDAEREWASEKWKYENGNEK